MGTMTDGVPTMRRLAAGASVLAAITGTVITARRWSLPRTSGALRLTELSAPVEVLRDRWGVPHIYAQSDEDLFVAQGYVHAQDRLWQMELQRRTGHGRLAEIFGPLAVEADRFLRVLGLHHVAQQEVELLEGEERTVVEAYARGINAYIQGQKRLPIEFLLLRYRPEPWQPVDSLVWAKVMALGLCMNWTSELLRARMVATVGLERTRALEPEYLATHPLVVPSAITFKSNIGAEALERDASVERFIPRGNGIEGSNAWVVGGQRTATGKPLLANDPHLMLQIPSLWYENHLVGKEYHVTGASIPGIPGVIIGHNERIAWGETNGMNDVQDLYVERFDPNDPMCYEFEGKWYRVDIRREKIRVRGHREPVIQDVRTTRHGPVIAPLIPQPGKEEEQLTLRWIALEPRRIVRSILDLNRARDWSTFRQALQFWSAPALNFVYADVDGHFGYALGGHIPIRPNGDGRLPVPGWINGYEWSGLIPHALLPHVLDPPCGFVVTANNRIVGDDYPYALPGEWDPGYRAERIRQLISAVPIHDVDSFACMQSDVRSLPGLQLTHLVQRVSPASALERRAHDLVRTWNGELTTDAIAATICTHWCTHVLTAAYSDVAGPLGMVTGIGSFATTPGALYLLQALPGVLRRAELRDDAWLPEDLTWDRLLQETWTATIADLRQRYGDDLAQWTYGRYHQLTLRHPLGVLPLLSWLLNRGPYPLGGGKETVCAGDYGQTPNGDEFYVGPSYRQICDLADWDRSVSIHPTGQAGHPVSRHYFDFFETWRHGCYHPMLWSRQCVERETTHRLLLDPSKNAHRTERRLQYLSSAIRQMFQKAFGLSSPRS
jgi:penicillin amidase